MSVTTGLSSAADRATLRDLALRLSDIAAPPDQQQRIERWTRFNDLEKVGPMILCMIGDASILVADEELACEDPLLRQIEQQIRFRLYRHEHLKDDWPIEPAVYVPLIWHDSGWGFETRRITPEQSHGAYRFDPVILDEDDLHKMRYPDVGAEWDETNRQVEAVADVLGDLLRVEVMGAYQPPGNPTGIFCSMRGLEQVMIDTLERPAWLHQVLEFMTEGYLRRIDQMEQLGIYTRNDNGLSWVGSGGLGYTRQLPAPGFDGVHIRARDIWGRCDTQEFHNVSPDAYWEFALQYQARILERYGLSVIACCEAMDGKYKYLDRIGNARRISVSPWADLAEAASGLTDRYIFSWKPNPATTLGAWNPDRIRRELREGLNIARDCQVEIVLCNIETVFGRPQMLDEWCDIAREAVEAPNRP